MNEQENTKLVQQVYENFKSGDIKALLNLLSDNIEWQLPEIENVPFAGKHRGHEQMGQFFASLVDTQEVQHFDPREFIAQGDKVVALGHYAWRVKSTGREFGGDFAHVFTVNDGKVIRFHEYMDTAAAAAAHREVLSARAHCTGHGIREPLINERRSCRTDGREPTHGFSLQVKWRSPDRLLVHENIFEKLLLSGGNTSAVLAWPALWA